MFRVESKPRLSSSSDKQLHSARQVSIHISSLLPASSIILKQQFVSSAGCLPMLHVFCPTMLFGHGGFAKPTVHPTRVTSTSRKSFQTPSFEVEIPVPRVWSSAKSSVIIVSWVLDHQPVDLSLVSMLSSNCKDNRSQTRGKPGCGSTTPHQSGSPDSFGLESPYSCVFTYVYGS